MSFKNIDKKLEKETEKKRLKKKKIIETVIFGFVVLAVIGGFIFAAVKLKDNSLNEPVFPVNAVVSTDQIKGNREAKTVLVEYSDFQCPACAAYVPLTKQLLEEFNDRIVFAYRHFPLSQHKNAKQAALASEAGGRQGKFWQIHDMIFENQEEWAETDNAEEIFIKYAEKSGLDIDRFKNDLKSEELKNKIAADLRSGQSANINSTPTFFLNGEKIQPKNYEEFKQMILLQIERVDGRINK